MTEKNILKTNRPTRWALISICLILGILAQLTLPVGAQTSSGEVVIGDLSTSEFPELTLRFKILHGSAAETSVRADQVSVIENGKPIALDSLSSEYEGVHFALAINPDRTLVLTYPSGYSNYDRLLAAMDQFGSNLTPVTGDVYSLFINPDIHYDQLENYTEWNNALHGYQANQKQMTGSLQSLQMAVQRLTASPTTKETVLVYMTPYIQPDQLPNLNALIEQAGQAGIAVHVWMTADAVINSSTYQINLAAICETWGGSLTILSGSQIPPNPRDYLKGKGFRYSAVWQSEIRSGDTQQIGVRVSVPGGEILSSTVSEIPLRVLPTSMTLINLPAQIDLTIRPGEVIEPAELPVQAAIEFPDGFPREILSTNLYVNGDLVQTNLNAPFGDFTVSLSPYLGLEKISLQLTLTDALGFNVRGEVKNIALTWLDPAANQPKSLISSPWLWAGLGLVALSLLAVIFVPTYLKRKSTRQTPGEPSQPTPRLETEPSIPSRTYGSLIKLDRDNTPSAEKPLLLLKDITLIGKDPQLANLVLNDDALEPLHAEIHTFADGRIRLTDFHTIAGTYVNFKAVDTKGVEIHHGDILHFGRLSFRFNSPSRVTSPKNQVD